VSEVNVGTHVNGRIPKLPPLFDIALAIGCTAVAITVGREYHAQWQPLDATGHLLTVLANVPIAMRRRAPVTVHILCSAAWLLFITGGYWPAVNVYGCMVAFYTLSVQRPRRVALPLGLATGSLWFYAGALADQTSWPSVFAQAVVFTAVLWKFGDNARELAERNQELAATSEHLRREQADRARRAVSEERLRIAGELHDVIAHHVAVVSVQAGLAGYVFTSDPGTARTALAIIDTTSRQAQLELRRVLGLLRTPTPAGESAEVANGAPARAPGLDRLEELVDGVRAAGVAVDVVTSGQPRPLPSSLDLCAYRVIQESLTNVLKHARAASATVALEYGPESFTARVTDDGRGGAATAPVGHGLTGMMERARLYGGTVTAGPRPGGGFEVTLILPFPLDAGGAVISRPDTGRTRRR
jgi:signal transduction histidine kinase